MSAADEVSEGQIADADLSPLPTIKGTVTQDGAPAEDATVVARQDDGSGEWSVAGEATTDSAGKYSLLTETGSYVVRFSKSGWRTEFFDDKSTIGNANPVQVVDNVGPTDPQHEDDADLALGTNIKDLTDSVVAQDLAELLAGDGVTVSNVSFSGDDEAAGSFQRFDPLGFDRGVILSSGRVNCPGAESMVQDDT